MLQSLINGICFIVFLYLSIYFSKRQKIIPTVIFMFLSMFSSVHLFQSCFFDLIFPAANLLLDEKESAVIGLIISFAIVVSFTAISYSLSKKFTKDKNTKIMMIGLLLSSKLFLGIAVGLSVYIWIIIKYF